MSDNITFSPASEKDVPRAIVLTVGAGARRRKTKTMLQLELYPQPDLTGTLYKESLRRHVSGGDTNA